MRTARSRKFASLTLAAGAVTIAGCAETTAFSTRPVSASLEVNGKYVGSTPVDYLVPRAGMREQQIYHYRLTSQGYEPVEGEFRPQQSPGRIGRGLLTAGLMFLFRSPLVVPDAIDVELVPIDAPAPSPGGNLTEKAFHSPRDVDTTVTIVATVLERLGYTVNPTPPGLGTVSASRRTPTHGPSFRADPVTATFQEVSIAVTPSRDHSCAIRVFMSAGRVHKKSIEEFGRYDEDTLGYIDEIGRALAAALGGARPAGERPD